MRAPRSLPVLAGLAGLLSSPVAWAAPPGPGVQSLHVLELATDDADDQAKALTLALKSRVRASKDYSLAEGDYALGVFLASLKCGDVPDATCQTNIADKLKTERYIWGTMRKTAGGQVAVDVHLWQKGQPEVRQQTTISDNLTVAEDGGLQKVADQLLNKLVTFGKVGVARVTSARPIEGDLFVDGQGQGKFTNQSEVSLPVGEHRFEVRSGGKVVAQGTGRVGATTPLEVELTSATGATETPTTSGPVAWKKPASYAAIGVGGAMLLGAGIMTAWGASDGFGNDSVKQFAKDHVRKGSDVCETARTPGSAGPNETLRADVVGVCDRGDTFKTLQYVFYPLGALLTAGGVYMLTSTKEQDASTTGRRIEVAPTVGRQGGSFSVRVAF